MDLLVTTEWLAAEIGASDLRIADASWFLPEHGRDAAAEFAARHLPGAVRMDLDAFADTRSRLPMMLPSPEQFASRMAALGLGDGTRIVLYDDSPLHSAARAWWMLAQFGVRAALLDGGLAKWRAEGRALESGAAAIRPRHVTPQFDSAGLRTLAQMQANVASGAEQVVDARSPARFAGLSPEPRPGIEPGHIPGSRNVPYGDFFDADGSWKRESGLRAAFEDAGIALDRPIVATCGSGVTAAVPVFAAHLLGHRAALYDGSWAEWGADATTPKAQGAA